MRSSIRSAAAVLSIVLASAAALPAAAEDPPAGKPPAADEPAATKNEAAVKFLTELKAVIGKEDEAASRKSIATLVETWKDKDVLPETKKPIPDVLGRYAREDKLPIGVAIAAIDAMGEISPEEGAKEVRSILEKAIKAKTPPVDVYGACLRTLKKLADPSKATVDALVSLLVRKENDVVGKAADAISGYKDAPGKVRRDLMEEVLKIGESAFQAAQSNKDSAATAKWNTIQGGVMSALRALSGQNLADPLAARKWFNDHKKDKIWS